MADRKRTFQVPHSGEKHQRCFGNSETDFELVQSMLRAVKQSCELLQVSPLLKIHFQRGGEGVAECDRDSAETCFTEIVTRIQFEPLLGYNYTCYWGLAKCENSRWLFARESFRIKLVWCMKVLWWTNPVDWCKEIFSLNLAFTDEVSGSQNVTGEACQGNGFWSRDRVRSTSGASETRKQILNLFKVCWERWSNPVNCCKWVHSWRFIFKEVAKGSQNVTGTRLKLVSPRSWRQSHSNPLHL